MLQSALVTGATGFVGSRLCQYLVGHGWKVHVVVRKTSDLSELCLIKDAITIHEYDETIESLIAAVQLAKPDIVFHVASLFIARHQSDQVSALIDSNLKFPTQLLEALALNKVKYFINTGTSWEYYSGEYYNPVCLYAATKQAFQNLIEYYAQAHGLCSITLRLFDTYGPCDPRKKIVALLQSIAEAGTPFCMSPGGQEIDLVYIDDVVEAYLTAAKEISLMSSGQRYYDISSGAPVTLRKLVQMFEQVSGNKLNIQWGSLPYRDRELMRYSRRLSFLPGWSAKISLTEGLKRLFKSSKKTC